MISESQKFRLKNSIFVAACLALGVASIANLACAFYHGEVFISRGRGWVSFDSNSVEFIKSIAASAVVLPICLFAVWIAIVEFRSERHAGKHMQGQPRIIEPDKISPSGAPR